MNRVSQNRLLLSLPPTALNALEAVSEFVHLEVHETLITPDEPINFVYFLESGVMSLVQPVRDRRRVEVATIGYEGMVGVQLASNVRQIKQLCFCQIEGTGLRVESAVFLRLLEDHREIAKLCQQYTMSLLDQVSHHVGCNQAHTVKERCAKWLLLSHDRCHRQDFVLTQEFLAIMLGVSRTLVNFVATDLAKANIIRYSRAKVTILDRGRLEQMSCPCYKAMTDYLSYTLNEEPGTGPVAS